MGMTVKSHKAGDAKWHKNGLDYKDTGDYIGGNICGGRLDKEGKNSEICDFWRVWVGRWTGWELTGLSIEFCVWFLGPEELEELTEEI